MKNTLEKLLRIKSKLPQSVQNVLDVNLDQSIPNINVYLHNIYWAHIHLQEATHERDRIVPAKKRHLQVVKSSGKITNHYSSVKLESLDKALVRLDRVIVTKQDIIEMYAKKVEELLDAHRTKFSKTA